MSWFQTGYGGLKEEEQRVQSAYGPSRFWMKVGDRRDIVFVDDEPACIYEHQVKIDDDWRNWFTCGRDVFTDDPACCDLLGNDSRSYVGFFTIVDLSEYVDSKGNHHQYELKLLPAKLKTLKKLQTKREDRENRLSRRIYRVTRSDDTAPNCGDDFEYQRDAEMDKLVNVVSYRGKKLVDLLAKADADELENLKKTFKLTMAEGKPVNQIVPFNYYEVLQPKKPKALRDELRGVRIEQGDRKKGGTKTSGKGTTGSSGSQPDDDVPF